MILDTAFNRMTASNGNLRNSSTNHLFFNGDNTSARLQCRLSTAENAISATQTTSPLVFETEFISSSGSSNSNLPGENYRATRIFFFGNVENQTRTVKTVYLTDDGPAGIGNRELIAAVLLPDEVVLGSFDTLEVIWTVEYNFSNGSGSITDGNHLGDTNISWDSYISEANALNMLTKRAIMSSQGTPVLGDDNTASDLNTSGIKGTVISGASTSVGSPSDEFNEEASGQWISYQRRRWHENQGNGEIGEMATNSFRITFDPKLNKQAGWRLWLTFGMIVARDPITQ